MAIQERDYMKGQEVAAPAGPSTWLNRVNEFGERHAKIIVTLSTALIILIVLLFAKYFYDRSSAERAEQELSAAQDSEKLKDLKLKYNSLPIASRIIYRLANQYYEDNKLEAALAEYTEFKQRFPEHPLRRQVDKALGSLNKNLKFEQEQKPQILKSHLLQSSPRTLAESKDPRYEWGPLPEPLPVVELTLGDGVVKIELYEDDAPNAVAHFLKLCEQKYFDGIKFEKIDNDRRLQTAARTEGAVDYALPYEASTREAVPGALVLIRKEGADQNVAGQFQILVQPIADLKDVTIFGAVTQNMPALQNLKKDDAIKSTKTVSKRSHPYEPNVLKKP